jgi:hypothetical protein
MKTRMKIENPGDVEVTLTVTMKASMWEALRDELSNKHPASEFSYRITDLLAQTRKVLWSDTDTDK